MEVLLNDLHTSKKCELIFNFNKVITSSCVNTAWNLDGNRNEVIHNFLDDVSYTVLFVVALDWWVKYNGSLSTREIFKINTNFKDWWVSMHSVILDIDLVSKVFHWTSNTLSNSLDYKPINIVNIWEPWLWFLVWLDLFLGYLEKPVNFFTMNFDIFKLWSNYGLMVLFELIWWEWLHSSIEEGLLPLGHHLLHFSHIVFHQSDKLINIGNDIHSIFDEWIDTIRVPFELKYTWL